MNKKRFLFKAILTSLAILFGFGYLTISSLVHPPKTIAQQQRSEGEEFPPRSPASIELSQNEGTKSRDSERSLRQISKASQKLDQGIYKYDCKNNEEFEVARNSMRLQVDSNDCLNLGLKDVSLVNQTNGYTANLFQLKKGFTSDFVDLSEGANNLVLSAIDKNGNSFTQKIKVIKRSVASETTH